MLVDNNFKHDARVAREANALRDEGCEVIVFAVADPDCPPRETVDGIEIRRVGTRSLRFWRAVAAVLLWWNTAALRWILPPRDPAEPSKSRWLDRVLPKVFWYMALNVDLARAAARLRPQVVHAHDLSTLPAGRILKRLIGALLVFDSHELFLHRNVGQGARRRNQMFWTLVEKLAIGRRRREDRRAVDAFITVNDSIAGHLNDRYPALPRAVIVRNASPAPDGPVNYDGRLHDAAGLPRESRILLFQGGIVPCRGLEALVRSGPLLGDDWAVVLMGPGGYRARLQELAREIDPAGRRVRFIGPAPHAELLRWTAGATLGVIPYENVCLNHWYCTPNKLWEYPAAGVPILASPFPEMRKLIEGNGIGRLLGDPVTPQNLADTVASITDQELSEMRDACAEFAKRDNWSIYAERLRDLYHHLRNDLVDPGTEPGA
ncbi:MAG: glycosyltransferase [Phycisphaerales bacterium]|nr:MAG: glycosyltransferase [Phycisphaerales bacterium]